MHRDQTHCRRGRHRPEPADHNANQGPARHIGQVIGCHRNKSTGNCHNAGQAEKQRFPVKRACQHGNKQAGYHCKCPGNGDALSGHAFGDTKGLRHRCQQADRHEFGGDQGEDAQRHGKDTTPVRRLFPASGVFFFCFCLSYYSFRDFFSVDNMKSVPRSLQRCRKS